MPFDEIVGHRAVVARIASAVARDSLPPSVLFTGPAGIGKRLLATAVAQALNCAAPRRRASRPAIDGCGACSACRRIANGTYSDVLFLEAGEGGSITIDQVRVAIEQVGYRPFEGRRRVIVVDDADLLVPAAQNALLKTLEEPPPCSQLVLVTARPDMLLDTVRSGAPACGSACWVSRRSRRSSGGAASATGPPGRLPRPPVAAPAAPCG